MESIEITSLSSRGQVVIPQRLREKLKIKDGEKFVIIGEGSTIILKKIEMPSFRGFEKLLGKTRALAKNNGLKEADIEEALKDVRRR
ncbi:AbrB/MazE/SpoVT family DNA-binding domain-containing protein [Candidatus Pacearchaeota archaeon]|nr:AbrB/MazE/SpoVT family DNA-binding domain-containing protein [Candidatus Pacearchaeota archaeon]